MSDWLPACGQLLTRGLDSLECSIPEDAGKKLLTYLQLLHHWNKAYNLTAIRDPREMVSRHLLDSLSILPYVHGERLLDVGTGAGLPGIPLAIARPEMTFSLLDSNGKKIRFLRQVVMELGLTNVIPIQQRLEQMESCQSYDQVTARAFSDLPRLWKLAEPLLKKKGEILALKGTFDTIAFEMSEIKPKQVTIIPLTVPLLTDEQRHLVLYRKES